MPRSTVVLRFVCAVLLSSGSVHAQYFGRNKVQYDRLDFQVLKTEHFDIYYYAEEEPATRQAARLAERWYARYSRLLDHTFANRQSLVLYANHSHFSQTNLMSGSPGESVGGFTEHLTSRIAMPFAAGLGETDHVLGHEIAHAFQIDIARRSKRSAFSLPGWFVEGMAEFLSLGPVNAHTAMWLRDAALHDALPTLDQLDDPHYFPYRYGHAIWAFLATHYGDHIIGSIVRSRAPDVLVRLEEATGRSRAELTREWHASIYAEAREILAPRARDDSRPLLGAQDDRTRLFLGPSLSPDASRLMFLSERDRLSLDLFMADTSSGVVTRKIVSTAADPHFDSLQYVHSAGSWDSSGRHFVFAALGRGEPILTIVDAEQPQHREEFPLPSVGEIYNPSWSPDGTRIVFSALKDGFSDLFIFTLSTKTLTQVTADAYADLHPAWSPDGHTIAFASDRFTTSLDGLRFGPLRVALLDVVSGTIRPVFDERTAWKQINPQWSPDSRSVYFVSDRDGVSNVYRLDLPSSALQQVTDVSGGVSGITATSPAVAVASNSGDLAYTTYRNGRYEICRLDRHRAMAGRVVSTPEGFTIGTSPVAPTNSLVSQVLADTRTGLPTTTDFVSERYDDRLRLEAVSQPYIGAASGSAFGGSLVATMGFSFGDTLRDRQLQTAFRIGNDADDLAVQLSYMNRRRQWNWGFTGGVVPSRFVGARRAIARDGDLVTRENTSLRYMHEWAGLTARYNLSRSKRFEFGAGVRRTGFEWQTFRRVTDRERNVVSHDFQETPAGAPIHLAETHAAFVHDTAVFGATSPILGQRYRFDVAPVLGALTYADVRIDYRWYIMPIRPITVASRIEHIGRYGPGASDPRLTPLILGLQTLVRGYDLQTFAVGECGRAATECSIMDELTGSRLALLNVELRAPLLGLLSGDIDYGRLPVEAIAFVDAGFLWTRHPGLSSREQDRFRSVGVGGRANLGGFVFEVVAARPFDRVDSSGWTLNVLLRPGF
jgi:Tol biopolymer transport system component